MAQIDNKEQEMSIEDKRSRITVNFDKVSAKEPLKRLIEMEREKTVSAPNILLMAWIYYLKEYDAGRVNF